MPLRTLVTDEEIQLLHGALVWIAAASEKAFARLFTELGTTPLPPPQIAVPLIAFDLAAQEDDKLRGLLRVRRQQGRFYVMQIGLGNDAEYLQDLWPETDALLAALDTLPPGRLLDLGTGCGIVGIEAALRGHRVVATDVYQPTVVLARFNARLNQAQIEVREGHLWAPVEGERFDAILTNPHYGRLDDQLRLEVLRGASPHLAPGGKLVLATVLEWEAKLGVECVLQPLAANHTVAVRPIESAHKREWFTAGNTVSRHRFTVEIGPGAGFSVEMPKSPLQRDFVPLSRLQSGWASVTTPADVAALDEILSSGGDLPFEGLLDACRWGARECVADRGAAGAILSADGRVRPCMHAPPLGTFGDTLADLTTRYQELAAAARARRGCDTCVAVDVCSRCLFPLIDEAQYCDFIRRHRARLPALHERLTR